MRKKIFSSMSLMSLLVILFTIAMSAVVLYNFFESELTDELKAEELLIEQGVNTEGDSYLDGLNTTNRRVTLIDSDGSVLYDNEADPSQMENHLNRKEIQEASKAGSGTSRRYSSTMTAETIYYARKLSDGRYLRVSGTVSSVVTILIKLIQPAVVILILALLISLILSSRLAKRIIKPLDSINLDDLDDAHIEYEELTPFVSRINAQQNTIRSQLKDARQKQEEFRMITGNMTEAVLMIDTDTRLLSYNKAAMELLGVMTDDAPTYLGTSVLSLNRSEDFRKVIEHVLKGKKTEITSRQNNRVYRIIATPVFDHGTDNFISDTRAEESSDDKSADKSIIIGAVILILDDTEKSGRENLRREFTANVSHELKTPLTSISGFAEILKQGGTDEETVKDFSTSIYDEAQRLITLVSDIIKVSQLEDPQKVYEEEDFNLKEVASNVVDRLKPNARKNDVTIKCTGTAAHIHGVRKIAGEIISNLADNAIKYNKPGGYVKVDVSRTKHHAVLTVEDNGIGIPKEDIGRIFERFYRVDKSRSQEVGGTGLGLAIVKHGVEKLKASIKMESEEGKGTRVTVRFRLVPEDITE